jgi:hypothetical protein
VQFCCKGVTGAMNKRIGGSSDMNARIKKKLRHI